MRDFFYSKGDVFIAVLIILVAVFVIYLRVGVIMGYDPFGGAAENLLPAPSAGPAAEGTEPDSTAQGPEEGDDGGGVPAIGPAETDPTDEGPDQAQTGSAEPADETPAQVEDQPPATVAMQITVVAGDAASTIADKLLAAGAISDKQAFLSDVLAQNADSRLKQGTFTIPAGASHADIIAILTK